VLLEVAHNPDQTVTQLAERMQLARNTVSTLVGQLDDAGLVVRSGDRADARLTRLTVSATAAERMTGWRARRATAVRDALASLSGRDLAAVSRAMKPLRALIGAVEERQDAGVQASGKGE
jgi:DNA-binding MarR family transcriptional regulator